MKVPFSGFQPDCICEENISARHPDMNRTIGRILHGISGHFSLNRHNWQAADTESEGNRSLYAILS